MLYKLCPHVDTAEPVDQFGCSNWVSGVEPSSIHWSSFRQNLLSREIEDAPRTLFGELEEDRGLSASPLVCAAT